MTSLMTPADIRKRAEEVERAKLREAMEELKEKQGHEEDLQTAFAHRDVHPEWRERLNRAITNAVNQGKNEVLIMRFPADWCTDKGRAINNFEPDWPKTLTGFAERAVQVFEKELAPLGYKAKAQVLSYPGGMLGEIGIFISW